MKKVIRPTLMERALAAKRPAKHATATPARPSRATSSQQFYLSRLAGPSAFIRVEYNFDAATRAARPAATAYNGPWLDQIPLVVFYALLRSGRLIEIDPNFYTLAY